MQCELACSFVKTGSFRPARSLIRVNIFDELASYSPYTCFQCAEAWCMTACPVNAVTIHPETGAKVVLEPTCVGCGLCSIACPFGTMFFNPDTRKAYKCDLCAGDPACAKACPTAAIEFKEIEGAPWLEPWSDQLTHHYREILAEGQAAQRTE
jgi:anaerobic carbon-monoxide dehydrogenase iron sulfur subunit